MAITDDSGMTAPAGPKSFADDGAFGAQSSSSPGSFGSGGGTPMSVPWGQDVGIGQQSIGPNGTVYGNKSNTGARGAQGELLKAGSFNPTTIGGGGSQPGSVDSSQFRANTSYNPMTPSAGFSFANGGAIDESMGDDQGGASGDGGGDVISRALGTVDQVLAYGRKLHGLGGGGNDEGDGGAIQGVGQQAGNMPAIPGNQSNSGMRPAQPAPGPLAPTSNPFGKRADAGNDGSSPSGGAIDTEEDT